MSEFQTYVEIGLGHVLDIHAYDHVLFLIALAIPYSFKDWKRLLLLVSIFTIGHTLALILSVFGIVMIKASLVEFLIPITILVTAAFHLFTAGKTAKADNISLLGSVTLFFGLVHGLGFSNYFKAILPGNPSEKLVPLLEFALGIEIAQLIVVLSALIFSYALQTFFRFNKRDYALVVSAFVIGVVIPMIASSEIWK